MIMAMVVKKKPGDSDDKLIAEFRKKVQAEQLLTEFKDREFYRPPSEEKKLKKKEVERRIRSRRE